jgi:hypothetical protein
MAETKTAAQPFGETIPVPDEIPIVLTVNGVETRLGLAPWVTLLDALRDHLDPDRHEKGVRSRPMRRVYRAGGRAAGKFLPDFG